MAAATRVDADANSKGNSRFVTGCTNTAGLSNATGVFIPLGIADKDLLVDSVAFMLAVIAGTAAATLTFGYAASGKAGLTETTPLTAAAGVTTALGGVVDTFTPMSMLANTNAGGTAGLIPAGARYGWLTNKSMTDVISIAHIIKFKESPQ